MRELVELPDLNRRVGRLTGGVRTRKATAFDFSRSHLAENTEVRLRLRAIVEAEHGDDIALQFGRKLDAAVANAISLALDRAV